MTRTLWLAALALFLIPGIAPLAVVASAQGVGPPPAKNYPEPERDAGGVPYWGTVTEITKDSITIQGPGEKPKKFPVSETLAAGKIPMKARPIPGRERQPYSVTAADMYRLTDVKVGDRVDIKYSSLSGVITCDHICIKKRPGGRVPPLPEEAEALRKPTPVPGLVDQKVIDARHIRYDEWVNAYWDLEDKGIPYPEKFGDFRRWPEAPMPREVRITTPPISP
jgi:hypothetical protein